MKKSLNYILTGILSIIWLFSLLWICEWQRVWFGWWDLSSNMPYDELDKSGYSWNWDSTDLWNNVSIKKGIGTGSIIIKLLEVFWLEDTSTDSSRDHKFLNYAKAIINMALWLLAFVALIMSIYTFYMMFFSDDEAWIKKAKWNLFGIFIALAIIWLAWIIVSFIFWRYQSNWKWRESDIETGNVSMVKVLENDITKII